MFYHPPMLSNRFYRRLLKFSAIIIFAAAASYAIHYRAQPLIDLYNFRQTQTALTSYWMIRDGLHIMYETPIGGAPWAIPFEFPIYQAIVAFISAVFHLPLDPVGRLVTFGFLAICVIPARQLQQRLTLPSETFWIFCCLLFSAPIYVYWGRTFMIETAAMYFVFASLPHFLDLLRGVRIGRAAVLFSLWTTLSLLQKVTTGLPVVAVLGVVWAANVMRTTPGRIEILRSRDVWLQILAFAVPICLGFAWTEYSSHVREQNTLGAYLTNSSLSTWNWGTMQQRFSGQFWGGTLWERLFARNLAGVFGLATIAVALLVKRLGVPRAPMALAVLLGLLPFFTFTNLYIVHDYYPTACVIFLLAALAIAIGHWATGGTFSRICSAILLIAFVGSAIHQFRTVYQSAAQYRHRVPQSPELALARILRASTSDNSALLLYGFDWSSQVAYFSQRRTFTVPEWPGELTKVWGNPQRYLGASPLGAIAICNGVAIPTSRQISERILAHEGYYGGIFGTCTILAKHYEITPPTIEDSETAGRITCRARVDSVTKFPTGSHEEQGKLLVINGQIEGRQMPQRLLPTFIGLARDGNIVRVNRALNVPPVEASGQTYGWSALVDITGLAGSYEVVVLSGDMGNLKNCDQDNARDLDISAILD